MFDEIQKIKIHSNSFSYKTSHFHQHHDVIEHLKEALTKSLDDLKQEKVGASIKKTVDLKKSLGPSSCVTLTGNEEIYYAQRKGRKTFTKFVKNINPPDCSNITFVISKVTEQQYKIITAYIGFFAEKEPLDPSIKTESEFNIAKEFWSNHALLEGSQKIYPGTATSECPWDTFENRIEIKLGNHNSDINNKIQQMRIKATDESTANLKLNC